MKVSRRGTPTLLRARDIKPRRSINRRPHQPLRGHKSHASDELLERGATAPLGGRLLAEGTPQGVIDREYIYLHDLPVAVIVE